MRQRLADEPIIRSAGPIGELKRMQSDGAASADELREFIGQLHGKSPQEVLGVVAASGLVRATLIATAGCAVLMAVFTVGPYLLNRLWGAKPATNSAARTPAHTPNAPTPEPPPTTADSSPVSNGTDPNAPDLEKAAATMGIGETKTADPKSNPLDRKLDNLLDGID